MKRVVIIGSGFAALSASCFLAAKGYEVKVLEKNSGPGGRARIMHHEGFTFDMGPSWYWMPDVFDRFFAAFGKSVSDYYTLQRLDPSYRVFFGEDDNYDVPADWKQLASDFEKWEAGAGRKLEQFLADAEIKYREGIGNLVFKPGKSILEFANYRTIKGLFELNLLSDFKRHVGSSFSHPKILKILEFPVLFLGATPEKTPALYSLMNYADIRLGTWFPMGGMHKIVEGMVKLATSLGVEFFYDQEVRKINIEPGGKASSVETASATFSADVVLSGADYAHTEQALLEPQWRNYSKAYWDSRVMAPSSILYYCGYQGRVQNLKHHNLFFDEDFTVHAREIYEQPAWPSRPLFYLSAPSLTDATLAPEGKENLFLLIPTAPGMLEDASITDHPEAHIGRRAGFRMGDKVIRFILGREALFAIEHRVIILRGWLEVLQLHLILKRANRRRMQLRKREIFLRAKRFPFCRNGLAGSSERCARHDSGTANRVFEFPQLRPVFHYRFDRPDRAPHDVHHRRTSELEIWRARERHRWIRAGSQHGHDNSGDEGKRSAEKETPDHCNPFRKQVTESQTPPFSKQHARPLLAADAIDVAVVGSDHDQTARNGGAGRDIAADFVAPALLAGGDLHTIDAAIHAAKNDSAVLAKHRRAVDITLRRKVPAGLAGFAFQSVNAFVPRTDDDEFIAQCGRCEVSEVAVAISPHRLFVRDVERINLLRIAAEVGHLPVHRGASGNVSLGIQLPDMLLLLQRHDMHQSIAPAEQSKTIGRDRRRAVDVVLGLHLPHLFARGGVDRVETEIVASDEHPFLVARRIVCPARTRENLVAGFKRLPFLLTVAIERIQPSVCGTDVADTVENERHRLNRASGVELPNLLPVGQRHAVNNACAASKIYAVAGDRGTTEHRLAGFERPFQGGFRRGCGCGAAGQRGRSTMHRPVVGKCCSCETEKCG